MIHQNTPKRLVFYLINTSLRESGGAHVLALELLRLSE